MFPSECVLERRVRSKSDHDLPASNLKLFILECKDKKADGYADDNLEIYNQRLKDMVIGVRLADAPPAVSHLVILHSDTTAEIVAVDKTVIVIRLYFPDDEGPSLYSYLIYDAVALSLRMIPAPGVPTCFYPLSPSVSLVRPCRGSDYALVHTRRIDSGGDGDYLLLWLPSSSSPPWSESKKARLPDLIDWRVNNTDTQFSFNGHAYWVDLLCGVSYLSCDALFDNNSWEVKFGGYIRLPVKPGGHDLHIAEPDAYRTMGVVGNSIRFVSIDGFQDHVKLENRTVTVWKLLGHDKGWQKEHKISLETLWGFEGFGDLPKDLTPMYPLLSTKDTDVVYLVLGEYREKRLFGLGRMFYPMDLPYLLAVDMRNKIVRTFVPREDEQDWLNRLISCGLSRYLCKALVGPCNDEGIPMKKKKPRVENAAGNVGQDPIPTKKPRTKKKKPRVENAAGNVGQDPIPTKKPRTTKKKPRVENAAGNVGQDPIPTKKPRTKKLMRC